MRAFTRLIANWRRRRTVRKIAKRVAGADYWGTLLEQQTPPEEVFGPPKGL